LEAVSDHGFHDRWILMAILANFSEIPLSTAELLSAGAAPN